MESAILNVPMKHSLATFNKEANITDTIIQHIRNIKGYELLKHDPQLIEYVCRLVEEGYDIYVDGKKPNKKELVIKIMVLCFAIRPEEQESIEKTIDYLWNNKRIKKVAIYKKIGNCVWDWAKRRIL